MGPTALLGGRLGPITKDGDDPDSHSPDSHSPDSHSPDETARTAGRATAVTKTVTLYLALLAIVAEVSVLAALVLFAGARLTDSGRRAADTAKGWFGPSGLALAFGVAAISMAGSLYFSEVAHFVPCRLCWYQRIAMYPLVPILGLAAWKRDLQIRRYGILLAAIGGAISTYHVLLERFPSLESSVCEVANPCTLIWVKRFGYLTIPTMALSAFALIIVLLAIARPAPAVDDPVDGESDTSHLQEAERGQATV